MLCQADEADAAAAKAAAEEEAARMAADNDAGLGEQRRSAVLAEADAASAGAAPFPFCWGICPERCWILLPCTRPDPATREGALLCSALTSRLPCEYGYGDSASPCTWSDACGHAEHGGMLVLAQA